MMKGGLFLVMGCVMYQIGSVDIEKLDGIGNRMPWTMAAFVIGGLGLIGVPLTVGAQAAHETWSDSLQKERGAGGAGVWSSEGKSGLPAV